VSQTAASNALSEAAVRKWFGLRRQVNQPTAMDKFCESSWRFTYYTIITVYGFVMLWDKSWFADTRYCWVRALIHLC
jgi:hypothetical protein